MASLAAALTAAARRYNVDPAAELAVANVEGGFGGAVGDRGTSFGPNQLHAGGALPGWVWARGAGFARRWASSPQGIDYTMRQIASVARGLHGAQAVNAIVRRFERPAAPGAEVARALSRYGGAATSTSQAAPVAAAGPGSTGGGGLSAALMQVLNSNNRLIGIPELSGPTVPGVAAGFGPEPTTNLQPGGAASGFLPRGAVYRPGRKDQGRDFSTNPGGAIIAPGAGIVVRVGSDPGGFGPAYPIVHFTSGPYAGQTLYIGHTYASLRAGQRFRPGQVISRTGTHGVGNATVPGWAEIGYAPGGNPGSFGQRAPF